MHVFSNFLLLFIARFVFLLRTPFVWNLLFNGLYFILFVVQKLFFVKVNINRSFDYMIFRCAKCYAYFNVWLSFVYLCGLFLILCVSVRKEIINEKMEDNVENGLLKVEYLMHRYC